jgi:CRP/FNR family cyclic AMP-dependent transcriptional regulator
MTERFEQRLGAAIAQGSIRAARVRVPRNAHVYNCGDQGADLYLVESGQVKSTTYSRDGKKCLLSIHASGHVFGELGVLSGGQRTETATTMRTTMLRCIPAAAFRAALSNGELLESFLSHLTLRLSEQQEVITNLVTMDSERRLAAALLTLANKLGQRNGSGTQIRERITQEELSGMVGTTRSRVGYFLKRFREAGLVQRPSGAFLVVNESSLADYLEESA